MLISCDEHKKLTEPILANIEIKDENGNGELNTYSNLLENGSGQSWEAKCRGGLKRREAETSKWYGL